MVKEQRPRALVTGAARGIGAAIVARLVRDGLRVLALDRDERGLAALAAQDDSIVPCVFDLTQLAATPEFLADLVRAHGVPTRLALNAGVWPGAPIAEMTDEVWNLNFTVNVTSPFAFMRALAPEMARAGGGAIVCTASRNAHRSSVNNAAYLKQIPMDRYGTPEEIAAVCAFLLSDDAGFLTGQDLIVDGGQIACQDNGRYMEIPGLRTKA
jgi:NAD(P)-dependent dehydrogenase (short-subunit alcohol dehydrogenase family)